MGIVCCLLYKVYNIKATIKCTSLHVGPGIEKRKFKGKLNFKQTKVNHMIITNKAINHKAITNKAKIIHFFILYVRCNKKKAFLSYYYNQCYLLPALKYMHYWESNLKMDFRLNVIGQFIGCFAQPNLGFLPINPNSSDVFIRTYCIRTIIIMVQKLFKWLISPRKILALQQLQLDCRMWNSKVVCLLRNSLKKIFGHLKMQIDLLNFAKYVMCLNTNIGL